jgi:hypothetical protein
MPLILQAAPQLLQRGQFVKRKHTQHCQGRVLRRHRVTFAHQETIALRPARVGRVIAHLVEIHSCDQICRRQRTPEVMDPLAAHHAHDIQAHLGGQSLQPFDLWLWQYIAIHCH